MSEQEMIARTDLTELAKRVEAGEAGLQIHKEILAALGYTWRGMGYWYHDDSHQWKGLTGFTTSVDAAMTLVPEGWFWMAGNRDSLTPRAYVENGKPAFQGFSSRRNPERFWFEVTAASPALALTAAALRARAAMGEG